MKQSYTLWKYLYRTLSVVCLLFILSPFSVFSQQDTRYDSGLNLPFNEKAGDVNPQTGNITLSFTDLSLPGRAGMNFSFGRIWSLNKSNVFTMYRDPYDGSNKLNSQTIEKQNNTGVGFSTTLPYILKDTSSGSLVMSLFFGGSVYEIDQSGVNIYNPNKSNLLWYDLLDKRVYEDSELSYGDFTIYDLSELQTEYGIADEPADRSAYVLILKTNDKYWFREDGRLMMRQDRTGLNKIWYFYNDESKLALVVDTIGRKIRFSYNTHGSLEKIEWDVTVGTKLPDETRSYQTETRSILYTYESAEDADKYPLTNNLKEDVIDYEEPFLLTGVTDPMGNVTRYEYREGSAGFTYDKTKSHSQNIYMMLTGITAVYTPDGTPDGKYKSKRILEYEVPLKGMYTKWFYTGYMEYYKISGRYLLNRHSRKMKDTSYIYHDTGEAGNFNRYTAVIEQGDVKTTYTYSLSGDANKNHVLDTLATETLDGFKQLTDYVYNADRTKALEEVFRQGSFVYREKFQYDSKGNLKRYEDKEGLVIQREYDDKYSIPVREVKLLTVDGGDASYEAETIINELGQVTKQIIYLKQPGGGKKAVEAVKYGYDEYGSPIEQTDAHGNTVYTVYDNDTHAYPVKLYQDVTIDAWSGGGTVHDNWLTEPDTTKKVRIRSWKVFNTDGSLWIEIDNEGYAIEHYYDANGIEIETVNPDLDDVNSFAVPIEIIDGNPVGEDFDDFRLSPVYDEFLVSRVGNPGARMDIDYQNEFIKTYSDIDVSLGDVKVMGVQKDGLGNVEQEIEYGEGGSVYAVKSMAYDDLGRMIGLTDPDAGEEWTPIRVNGTTIERHDKTWVIKYDDLGRKILVLYPETGSGSTHIKRTSYNDKENSSSTIDPEGRRLYERRDWNNNVIEVIASGNATTREDAVQTYEYEYDELGRKVWFKDAKGIETRYFYDERNLLTCQYYGDVTGSDLMEYNDRGELVKKTDRKEQVISFTYDQMGRNTSVVHYLSQADYDSGNIDHTVDTVYDNRGNAVRISNSNLIEHYIYDHSNRVITLSRRLKDAGFRTELAKVWEGSSESQLFNFSYEYNDMGMVKQMTYPDDSVCKFTYDEILARLKSIEEGEDTDSASPFVAGFDYNKSGVVTNMEYSNNTAQTWQFDNRKRISHINITGPGNTEIEDLRLTLNSVGDILSINENEYTYDGFDRIIGAKTLFPDKTDNLKLVAKYFGTYEEGDAVDGIMYTPDADLNTDARINGDDHLLASMQDEGDIYDIESFEYDRNGNRTKLIQNGDEYTYIYGIRNRLEEIYLKKKGAPLRQLFVEYTYDANGNTIKRIIHNDESDSIIDFEYDTLNRLIKTTEELKETNYFYDNAGNRFIKQTEESTSFYFRHGQIAVAMDIELPSVVTEYKGKINKYVLSGDLLAGRITKTVAPDDTTGLSKSWYHLDHLNSTKCITDESGQVEVNYTYRAFGEQLRKLGEGDAKYTYGGKELDENTNLYYFNARYYDATIGRFINVDPIQDGSNWYVYCNNNPLNAVDLTGLRKNINLNVSVYSVAPEDISHYTGLFARNEKRVEQLKNLFGGIIGISTGLTGTLFQKLSSVISAIVANGYTGFGMLQPSGWDQVSKLSDFREKYETAIANGSNVQLTMILSTQTVTLAGPWNGADGIRNSEKRLDPWGPFQVERTYNEYVYQSSLIFTATWLDENSQVQTISYATLTDYDTLEKMESRMGNQNKLGANTIEGTGIMSIGSAVFTHPFFDISDEQWESD